MPRRSSSTTTEAWRASSASSRALRPVGEALLSLKDPIDDSRELARAISKETIARMMLASRSFLDGPGARLLHGRAGESEEGPRGEALPPPLRPQAAQRGHALGRAEEEHEAARAVYRGTGFRDRQGVCRVQRLGQERDNAAPPDRAPAGDSRRGWDLGSRCRPRSRSSSRRTGAGRSWSGPVTTGGCTSCRRGSTRSSAGLLAEICRSKIEGLGASRRGLAISIRKNGRIVSGEGRPRGSIEGEVARRGGRGVCLRHNRNGLG